MRRVDLIKLLISELLTFLSGTLLVFVFYNAENTSPLYKILSALFYVFSVLNVLYISKDEKIVFADKRKFRVHTIEIPFNLIEHKVINIASISELTKLSKKKRIGIVCYRFNVSLIFYYIKEGDTLYLYKNNRKADYRNKIRKITA